MSTGRSAYICDGMRSPIGRYGGALSRVRPDDLLALILRALMERNPSVDWAAVDDVIVGCANQAGEDNRNVGRMASLLAGLPETVPASTINRLCGSGLDAVAIAARAISAGDADLMIAGGVESMSRAPFVVGKAAGAFARNQQLEDSTIGWRFVNPRMHASHGTDSMPETAENVARMYGISRADQDAFALRSQQRAAAAIARGRFVVEIKPVTGIGAGAGRDTIAVDEHPRSTTLEKLSALAPVTGPNGSVTAGNASGVNDGAAALVVASEAAVLRHRLTPIARILGAQSTGVAPRIMGIGPVPAVNRLLTRLPLDLQDFDWVELNEAFAAQSLAVLRQLGLPDDAEHVNPNGGAIALGHPLGMSGTRLALSAARQLERVGGRYALCTMCIGVGQGIALALERA